MTRSDFSESVVEQAARAWLEVLGCATLHGSDIAAGEPGVERSDPKLRMRADALRSDCGRVGMYRRRVWPTI